MVIRNQKHRCELFFGPCGRQIEEITFRGFRSAETICGVNSVLLRSSHSFHPLSQRKMSRSDIWGPSSSGQSLPNTSPFSRFDCPPFIYYPTYRSRLKLYGQLPRSMRHSLQHAYQPFCFSESDSFIGLVILQIAEFRLLLIMRTGQHNYSLSLYWVSREWYKNSMDSFSQLEADQDEQAYTHININVDLR